MCVSVTPAGSSISSMLALVVVVCLLLLFVASRLPRRAAGVQGAVGRYTSRRGGRLPASADSTRYRGTSRHDLRPLGFAARLARSVRARPGTVTPTTGAFVAIAQTYEQFWSSQRNPGSAASPRTSCADWWCAEGQMRHHRRLATRIVLYLRPLLEERWLPKYREVHVLIWWPCPSPSVLLWSSSRQMLCRWPAISHCTRIAAESVAW